MNRAADRVVLVLNSGSSSLKYRLLQPVSGDVLAGGTAERIGVPAGRLTHEARGRTWASDVDLPDHAAALSAVQDAFAAHGPQLDRVALAAVGHRVVHGGERFRSPVVVDDAVEHAIDELAVLAPLHNPAGLAGIRTARREWPDVPHVAVFDTAFHATIPPAAATYAVPGHWRERYGVRRYGFHGTSYAWVSRAAARLLGRPLRETRLVVAHLGNGASACAVAGGRSVDTSMGLTPLEGLVMGTRSGDVDPALPGHLARVAGMSAAEVDRALNRDSGLRGLAGAADVRDLLARAAAGDAAADLALDVYAHRIRRYVGAFLAVLGGADAVVLTGGVGEHAAPVRQRALGGLEGLGIVLDPRRNAAPSSTARTVSADGSAVQVLVVPTDEEREIATQALDLLDA